MIVSRIPAPLQMLMMVGSTQFEDVLRQGLTPRSTINYCSYAALRQYHSSKNMSLVCTTDKMQQVGGKKTRKKRAKRPCTARVPAE